MVVRYAVQRRAGSVLTALVTTLGLVFTGATAGHATFHEPVTNASSTLAHAETLMVAAPAQPAVDQPWFITNPADQTVAVGEDAVFAVTIDTPATVTWESAPSVGGVWSPVESDAGVTVSADGLELTVTGTRSNNGSQYRAIATNNAGPVVSSAADLTVVFAPRFITEPANQSTSAGSTAEFIVEVVRADTVSWEVSTGGGVWNPVTPGAGVSVSADGRELDVVASALNDGSQYRAVAANIAGTVISGVATLTVVPSPGFVTNPADQTVAVGEDAVFAVVPDSEARVYWQTSAGDGDGWILITPGDGAEVSPAGWTLTVTGTVSNNGHQYRAIAENMSGRYASAVATLTVVEAPVILTNPTDQTVAPGATADFTVAVEHADVVAWEVSANAGGSWVPVTVGAGVSMSQQDRVLHVVGSAANDGSQYRAVASNIAGTATSTPATLAVAVKPVFVTDPVAQAVVLGAPAVFTVATDEPATVTWQVSSNNRSSWVPVVPGAGVTVTAEGLMLTVTGTLENDGHYYRAVASNGAGSVASSAAMLTVISNSEPGDGNGAGGAGAGGSAAGGSGAGGSGAGTSDTGVTSPGKALPETGVAGELTVFWAVLLLGAGGVLLMHQRRNGHGV